ncbi:FliM/FliN family flagellar motor switch protein [Kiloniella sp. b19]|uniref:FliM/FliN family flagellar motor switch protein n=1 Tax=Kiloniella sp. GXU_MW_B19 TaxID=3141326 RepID=UPI0031CF3C24
MSDEEMDDLDDDAMARAMEEMGQSPSEDSGAAPVAETLGEAAGFDDETMPAIHGVELEVSAILGTAQMPVSQLLKMGRGAVVELDKYIGDTIEISINDQIIAKGEVMIKDEYLCVEVQEMVRRTN